MRVRLARVATSAVVFSVGVALGETEPPAAVAALPALDAVRSLHEAQELLNQGRADRSPDKLLRGVLLWRDTPTASARGALKQLSIEPPETIETRIKYRKDPGFRLDEKKVLDEALELAKQDPALTRRIRRARKASPKETVAEDRPLCAVGRVPAHSKATWEASIASGEAAIAVQGDGDTDLDCLLLDPQGAVLQTHDASSRSCLLTWKASSEGKFQVQIDNRNGDVFNNFRICMNARPRPIESAPVAPAGVDQTTAPSSARSPS